MAHFCDCFFQCFAWRWVFWRKLPQFNAVDKCRYAVNRSTIHSERWPSYFVLFVTLFPSPFFFSGFDVNDTTVNKPFDLLLLSTYTHTHCMRFSFSFLSVCNKKENENKQHEAKIERAKATRKKSFPLRIFCFLFT